MPYYASSYTGMVASPHRLASEAGLSVLRAGGNAVEAVVSIAAVLSVVYPHMTGLGGDGFWLILPGRGAAQEPESLPAKKTAPEDAAPQARPPHGRAKAPCPLVIDASGRSALLASYEVYEGKNPAALPKRGPLAAMTMAGAVSGWQQALEIASAWQRHGLSAAPLPLERLLAGAVSLAENGYPVSHSQSSMSRDFFEELAPLPGFGAQFLPEGGVPETERLLRLPALAASLRRLAREGLGSFYTGSLARDMAGDLEAAGSLLRLEDFTLHRAKTRSPLSIALDCGTVYNSPPPTQGAISLLILSLTERFSRRHGLDLSDERCLVHAVAEATKQAFQLRNAHLADPEYMTMQPEALLSPDMQEHLLSRMRPDKAAPWPQATPGGDTVWLGAVDSQGTMVSYIQSIYHEFGSGLVLPKTGITWNNRGLGFSFGPGAKGHPNCLAPGKHPFHTLNPALALLHDGRTMAYGTMGGDGQPQTQAAIFFRHIVLGMPLREAVSAPRWLLGRSWGDASANLKLERGFSRNLAETLRHMGHDVEETPSLNSLMGHAGALVLHADGRIEGTADPRSDGAALGL